MAGTPRERDATPTWSASTPANSSCPRPWQQSAQMLELAAEKPSALLCFERDPRHCHRTLLLGAVAADAEVVDLFA